MNLKIILYSILLIIGNLIVGIPGKENLVVVNCLYILIGIIYYLYKLIKYKNYKILTNKLDIFVFIFLMICPFLPLMFDTYASLEKSMLEVFRAISVFSMYIITRDLLKTNKKEISLKTSFRFDLETSSSSSAISSIASSEQFLLPKRR